MLHETLPTMTVIRFGEPVRINVSDYDPKVDKLPEDAKPRKSTAPVSEPQPEPSKSLQLGLLKNGRRYFVVDLATSEPVDLDGIDPEGYTTEAAAIEAAQAAMAG